MQTRNDRLQEEILAGVLGGLAGSLLMSAAMNMAEKQALIPETLPHRVERKLATRAGVTDVSARQEKALAQGSHFAIGALYGASYGLLHHTLDLPVAAGPLYGLGIYAANLVGLGPAFDLTEGPWNEEPKEVGRRMMMHALFGLVTAAVAEQVRG